MPHDLSLVLLLGLLGAALLVYGFIDRRGSAGGSGGYWPWAWALLAAEGSTAAAGGGETIPRVLATFVPVLLLAGAIYFAGRRVPGWLVPAAGGLAVLRGLLGAWGLHDAGAVTSLATDVPAALAAAWITVRAERASDRLRLLGRCIAIGLVCFAAVEALEALERLGLPVPHSAVLSWIVVGVPLGALQFIASLEILRKRVDRSEDASDRSARQLAESEARLRTILSSLGGTRVVLFDRRGTIQSIFGAPEDSREAPIDRVLRTRSRELLADAPVQELIREVHETGRTRETRRVVAMSEGSIWLDFSFCPVRSPGSDSSAVLAVIRDVSEQVKAEEERLGLEARMQQAQKLESLDVLAGGIAHDFNNLLVGILGNAELLQAALDVDSAHRRFVDDIEQAGERASELTLQLLAYAGRAEVKPQTVDLVTLVREMAQLLRAGLSGPGVLRLDAGDDEIWIDADPTRLRQVVLNLITNASDALEARPGFVTVRTGVRSLDRDELRPCLLGEELDPGDYAFVEVEDTGSGIAPEHLDKIFDPFFSTKISGRGLGLAAVLGIVRSHRGAVHVESRPSHGTRFRIYLPLATGRAEAEAEPLSHGAWRGEGTVLVVDDEEIVRRVATEEVKRLGFGILPAASGAEALDLFREHESEIVCALVDITMPVMDGEGVFEALREIRPDLPVLFMTGHISREMDERMLRRSEVAPLRKPFPQKELARRLRELLDGDDPGAP